MRARYSRPLPVAVPLLLAVLTGCGTGASPSGHPATRHPEQSSAAQPGRAQPSSSAASAQATAVHPGHGTPQDAVAGLLRAEFAGKRAAACSYLIPSSQASCNRLPVGSMAPGVFEFDTSRVLGLATYPMKVMSRPLVDRFSATSDFDEKLVTAWSSVSPALLPDPVLRRGGADGHRTGRHAGAAGEDARAGPAGEHHRADQGAAAPQPGHHQHRGPALQLGLLHPAGLLAVPDAPVAAAAGRGVLRLGRAGGALRGVRGAAAQGPVRHAAHPVRQPLAAGGRPGGDRHLAGQEWSSWRSSWPARSWA